MKDIYAEVRLLSTNLSENGMKKEASEILSALQEGATATEILMILRHRIQILIKNNKSLNIEVMERSKLIIDEINEVC